MGDRKFVIYVCNSLPNSAYFKEVVDGTMTLIELVLAMRHYLASVPGSIPES